MPKKWYEKVPNWGAIARVLGIPKTHRQRKVTGDSKLRYYTEPSKIPSRYWKGRGFYYKKGNKWIKWNIGKDKKRGGKLGTGAYRYKHD